MRLPIDLTEWDHATEKGLTGFIEIDHVLDRNLWRRIFAGQIMVQAIQHGLRVDLSDEEAARHCTRTSVELADALLDELEKREGQES